MLTTRSLIYSESLNRVQIFLALLAGAVIGLALLAQVDQSGETFIVAAILILSVVLFVGLATVGRLSTLNRDDFVTVLGMNRLRRAYLDAHPDLAPYFLAASHDDLRGVMQTMNTSSPTPAVSRHLPRYPVKGFPRAEPGDYDQLWPAPGDKQRSSERLLTLATHGSDLVLIDRFLEGCPPG